jgi:hypothetical protein
MLIFDTKVGYIIAWTPYCILMLYRAFTSLDSNIKLIYTILPTIAQKITVVWYPLLEMLFNSSVRKNLLFLHNAKKERFVRTSENKKLIENPKKFINSSSNIDHFNHESKELVLFN